MMHDLYMFIKGNGYKNSKEDKPARDKDFEELNAGEKKKVKTLWSFK